jgi:hypothetical protein
LVLEYYLLLRSVLRTKPHLRGCLTRCRQCRIFFLTHPRNRGRHDLRCPFGCREAHRKQASTQRSVAYYQGKEGRQKKALQNAKRKSVVTTPSAHPPREPWSEAMLRYLCLMVSLMEGHPVTRPQVQRMLTRILRQHRMVRRRAVDHTIAWLKQHPP